MPNVKKENVFCFSQYPKPLQIYLCNELQNVILFKLFDMKETFLNSNLRKTNPQWTRHVLFGDLMYQKCFPLKNVFVQVLRQWERMCWSLAALKMLECPLQCCCTPIATMNAPGVSVFVCLCRQLFNVMRAALCGHMMLHHLGFP